jgi:hypothetical protein
MTDWLDEIAAVNAITRNAVRELIDRGMTNDVPAEDIANSLQYLDVFDETRIDLLGKADMAPAITPALPPRAYGMEDMATGFMAAIRSLAEPPTVNIDVRPTPVNIDVHPTPVNVAAPIVNIAQAEAKAAMVMPAPVVNVNVSDLAITKLPDRVTRRQVKRDKGGKITETLEVESDAP